MTLWDGVVRLAAPAHLEELASRFGGTVTASGRASVPVERIAPIERAGAGDLAPLLASRFQRDAEAAIGRGACVLADAEFAAWTGRPGVWSAANAAWVLAEVLGACERGAFPAACGEGTVLGPGVVLGERVVVGRNVTIGAGSVIGSPGFGWVTAPSGEVRRVPQLGGVFIEDDVAIGPLCTIDAGTLSPTRIRRGARLDAQVHVGHNVEIGEGTMVAAQAGFAGSVRVGRGVLVGGQAGVADHVTIGDGARVAAKSGVIGDVPGGATVAGYPAVPRARWLRALARLYRLV